MPDSPSEPLLETKAVLSLLEERGVRLDREGLSLLSDRLSLFTRPPIPRCPRRWTLSQVEFIAEAVRLRRRPPPDEAIAALVRGDDSLMSAYWDEMQEHVQTLASLAPAANAAATAFLHMTVPAHVSQPHRKSTAAA